MDIVLERLGALENLLSDMERTDKEWRNSSFAGRQLSSEEINKVELNRDEIEKNFHEDYRQIMVALDSTTKEIRQKQPELSKITKDFLNLDGAMPESLAMGKYHVRYNDREWDFPRTIPFPMEKPMYIEGKAHFELFQKVILRLMYALPVDRQEYYIYDPVNLGEVMVNFNSLFQNAKLFPQKKVMINQKELKEVLKGVIQYINSLYQSSFNVSQGIRDWKTYNKAIYESGDLKKLLPYKVFVFANLPDKMDQETFDMIRTVINHSYNCGFLVLFSFNRNVFEAEDTMRRQMVLDLKEMINDSLPLHAVFEKNIDTGNFKSLSVELAGDKMPDEGHLSDCLTSLDDAVKNNSRSMFNFDDLLEDSVFQKGDASESLSIPVGFTTSGGKTVCMEIGDASPHYLVGGITGSGKSNFLHTLITSACWKYSPRQLQLYLLDFKEGVEFKQYADFRLPNAALVATEADKEYGVRVLEHLDKERAIRYSAFKKSGCRNIAAYNRWAEERQMSGFPRLLIIIDEFQVLLGTGSNADPHVMALFTMLAKQGRACGIHMVLSTQSLSGLSFGDVETQFGGRVALRCSADDSKRLLGGIASGNEEAAELEIPFAIMNVSQGSIGGNIRFAIPCAVPSGKNPSFNPVEAKIEKINDACTDYRAEMKIFEGQRAPEYPDRGVFETEGKTTLTLGMTIDFASSYYRIELKEKPENNLLICGKDFDMKKNLILSSILSVAANPRFDSCVYVGDSFGEYGFDDLPPVLECYETIAEFMESCGDDPYEASRLVILDNCNLAREIGFPTPAKNDSTGLAFMGFWNDCCRNGSFMVAFYDGASSLKSSGFRSSNLSVFGYRIGFSLNESEIQYLLDNTVNEKINCANKAFCVYDLKQTDYFRPFAERTDE